MPIKPRRKHLKKRVTKMRRHFKRHSKLGIPGLVTNYVDRIHHQFMPTAYRTKLYFSWTATEAPGATALQTFNMWLNNAYQPGNVTGQTINSVALAAVPGASVDEAFTISGKQPAGLSRFFNSSAGTQMYQTMHVISSKISVRYVPNALSDSITVGLIPIKDDESSPFPTVGIIEEAPYGKCRLITTSTPDRDQVISSFINIPKYLGVNEVSYLSNSAYATQITSPSTISLPEKMVAQGAQIYWTVRRSTLDNAVTSASLPCHINLCYDVVFQSLANRDIVVN